MRVGDFRIRRSGSVAAAEAEVRWEDVDRPRLRVFVETDGDREESLQADPSAFLPAVLLAAWHAGERRVRVQGSLCPLLGRRIRNALVQLREWDPDLGSPPAVETTEEDSARPPSGPGAVSLLSCGIDSLFTLRWNLLHVPRAHPLAIEAAIVVWYGSDPTPPREPFAGRGPGRLAAARAIGSDGGVDILPARTNLWWLDGDGHFFDLRWHGAVLATIAACFSGGFSTGLIASSFEGNRLTPWGSHPLLDPNYGSLHFRIEHDGEEHTRFQKVRLVSRWPAALANLRVCQNDDTGSGNCGTCEKCIRTMLALVALGRLAESPAFPREDVDRALIATIPAYGMIVHDWQRDWYRELRQPLTAAARRDLVEAVDEFVLTTDTRGAGS